MRYILLIVGLFCCFSFTLAGEDSTRHFECTDCHNCETPTPADKCLKPCPTLMRPSAHAPHKVSEAPDTFVIDEISNLYQAVIFNHKLHANMAQMDLDCETCHHYSPPGDIPPCKECHGGEKNPNNLRQPSLKGAYHRMCLSCHREWSHDTKCIVCHLPIKGGLLADPSIDTTDIIGAAHPKIVVPTRKIYNTPYEDGPVVTFYHDEHVELFDLRCVDCHQEENCSYCHDLEKETKIKKTDEEVHAICNDCHIQDNCATCHDRKTRPGFTHPPSWKQSKYHEGLECRNCHPTGKQITSVSGKCVDCHEGWNFGNFRHQVTGLRIDEVHIEFDCEDCHVELKYHAQPACDGCHDDDRTSEDAPPGEYIK